MPHGKSFLSSANLGLAVGVWMYSGYESMSTVAGQMERPQRIVPRALMITMPLVVAAYFLPTLAGLVGVGHWSDWATSGGISFVQLARTLGGAVLGYVMLGAAVISNLALYQDYVTVDAAPAYAMAEDRLLPKWLNSVHPRYGTPWLSILLLAGLNMVFIIGSFADLVVVDVVLNMFYYLVMYVTAVRLRQKEPGLERPFRVWGNTTMLVVICAPAMAIAVLTVYSNAIDTSTKILGHASFTIAGFTFGWYGIGGLISLVSGPIAYVIFKKTLGGRPLDAVSAVEPTDLA
jgi:amino acid transporter